MVTMVKGRPYFFLSSCSLCMVVYLPGTWNWFWVAFLNSDDKEVGTTRCYTGTGTLDTA